MKERWIWLKSNIRGAGFTTQNHSAGFTTLPIRQAQGSGDLTLSNWVYNPADGKERDYRVKITTPGEVGTAQYLWSDDGGATWNGPNPTSTSPQPLSHGISIAFVPGTGQDFFTNDVWQFYGLLPHGYKAGLDENRNSSLKSHTGVSALTPLVLTLDYGSAGRMDALILYDARNLSKLEVLWGDTSPPATLLTTIPFSSSPGKIFIDLSPYTPAPHRYWALKFYPLADGTPVEISEIVMGEALSSLPPPVPPIRVQKWIEGKAGIIYRSGATLFLSYPELTSFQREMLESYLSEAFSSSVEGVVAVARLPSSTSSSNEVWLGYLQAGEKEGERRTPYFSYREASTAREMLSFTLQELPKGV